MGHNINYGIECEKYEEVEPGDGECKNCGGPWYHCKAYEAWYREMHKDMI